MVFIITNIKPMKKICIAAIIASTTLSASAQKTSNASFMHTTPKADVTVPFKFYGEGVKTPIEWGLDLAWLDEANVRTGVFYAGKDVIDIMRLSFQPTYSVADGKFNNAQISALNKRITAVKNWCKSNVQYNINCDHASLDDWYNEGVSTTAERAKNWAKLIDMTADYYKSKGLTNLVSISPLNEPDYDYHALPTPSHRKADFKEICRLLKEDEAYKDKYKDVRMCGGNVLNPDKAYEWWNYLKTYLDEGNTHQLAGSFDNYANFFQTLTKAGMHATNDELHNVMEGIVGVEYGMQTAIWWGTCEKTRSDFMKATYQGNPGVRLGYGEHRNNWTAASVYRHANGLVQAFGGTSERQAVTTSYNFISTDIPVWYNGVRSCEYRMDILGGTGYQQGQTGYENEVEIQNSDDVMPVIVDGMAYKIVNLKSAKLLGCSAAPSNSWTSIKQVNNSNKNPGYQQWLFNRVTSGDRAYYLLKLNVEGSKPIYIDILDWNYKSGADVGTFPGGGGSLEQWYLEYAGDNSFYIRSRYSTKYLEVAGGTLTAGANIQMADFTGKDQQKWRILPVDVTPDKKAPAAPTELTAKANNASIELSWTAPADEDLNSYTILRSENGVDFITLANNVKDTIFVDNETNDATNYSYKVYAEDMSLNRSEHSAVVTALTTMEKGLVADLVLNDSTFTDLSDNANHSILNGKATYTTKSERTGLTLDGSSSYLQLPYTVANHDALTVSMWLYYSGGNSWSRIFDFGNGTDSYMFLTPYDGARMRFAIKNGGEEEIVRPTTAKKPRTNGWSHIAFTIDNGVGIIYLDGEEVARNESLTIKPSDIKPMMNYIGRSQFASDPMLKGHLYDLKIFNYALDAEEVKAVMDGIETGVNDLKAEAENSIRSNAAYRIDGTKASESSRGIIIKNGKKSIK